MYEQADAVALCLWLSAVTLYLVLCAWVCHKVNKF